MFARIKKSHLVRGITFLPQQFSGLLPHGEYRSNGKCQLEYSDRGTKCQADAISITRIKTGEVWYVSEDAFNSIKTDK